MAIQKFDYQASSLGDAYVILAQNDIMPEPSGDTRQKLTDELARRGWRWNLTDRRVEVEKAYARLGMQTHKMIVEGDDQVEMLVEVLARAIQIDDTYGLSPVCPFQADIEVRARSGHVVAYVEVNNQIDLTADVAIQIHRAVIPYAPEKRVPFFIIVSQDAGFLWTRATGLLPWDAPLVEFSPDPILARYLPWSTSVERLYGSLLEVAITEWLDDLAAGFGPVVEETEAELRTTGFLDAIRGAVIMTADQV